MRFNVPTDMNICTFSPPHFFAYSTITLSLKASENSNAYGKSINICRKSILELLHMKTFNPPEKGHTSRGYPSAHLSALNETI
jgi:hypothetical protein